jgi:hypothetical protein
MQTQVSQRDDYRILVYFFQKAITEFVIHPIKRMMIGSVISL